MRGIRTCTVPVCSLAVFVMVWLLLEIDNALFYQRLTLSDSVSGPATRANQSVTTAAQLHLPLTWPHRNIEPPVDRAPPPPQQLPSPMLTLAPGIQIQQDRLNDVTFWRGNQSSASAPHGHTCPRGVRWVTQVAGDRHGLLALCLNRQLRRHASACPLLVVHDDLTRGSMLANSTITMLVHEVELMPLSALVERAFLHLKSSLTTAHESLADGRVLASFFASALTRVPPPGESASGGHLGSAAIKYWLWALEPRRFDRVAYLDVDILLLQNIDELLHTDFEEPLAAVTSGPLCQYRSFNSGIMVLKPSLDTLAWLLLGHRFANPPWKVWC